MLKFVQNFHCIIIQPSQQLKYSSLSSQSAQIMNMKKRSQSSLRSKTLQSEDDQSQTNYWIGNLQAKKILTKAGQKITSSMIQCNKQNEQVNISNGNSNISQFHTPIYQSVYEAENSVTHTPMGKNNKGYTQKRSEEKDDKKLISELKKRCTKYQKELLMIYSQQHKNDNYNSLQVTPNSQQIQSLRESNCKPNCESLPSGEYNYMERAYQSQIELLKQQNGRISQELERYKQYCSNKQSQVNSLSEGLEERIEKENQDKNVYIKELNNNAYEIKKLKEQNNLHKSEKETMRIVLEEKQTIIHELEASISQVEIKRKKIQGYEMQLRQSQATLNEIQLQMTKLRAETEKKDTIIQNSNKKITNLQAKLVEYQQQMCQLEKAIIAARQNSNDFSHKMKQMQEECQDWKNKYCEVKQQVQQIPELQIKLKNTQLTVDDLQTRMKQLISTNEKLKIELGNNQTLKGRVNEQEKQISNLKKILREKCEELQTIQNNSIANNGLKEELEIYKNKASLLERANQEKQQELRLMKVKIQEKDHKLNSLYEQLQQTTKERVRIKELQSKIDTLFSQNEKLHCSLLEKVGEIEELHRKISALDSKHNHLYNQYSKTKGFLEDAESDLTECQSKLDNMKNRWESELASKMILEEKCNRLNKQAVGLKAKIENLQETNKMLTKKTEQISQQFDEKKKELTQQLDELLAYKRQSSIQIEHSNKKIQNFHSNIKELKCEIDRQMNHQKQSMKKIGQLQTYIIELQEELSAAKTQAQNTKKLWAQIQEISDNALRQYK